jgi:ribulose-5-phosphate 4-epimerase/fuculose-1-phosphate aldolase
VQRLAAALRILGRFGFDESAAGRVVVRDPERPTVWTHPPGTGFRSVRVRDLLETDEPLGVVSDVLAARPDAVAVAHVRSLHATTWSSFGRLLEPITQDACAFHLQHALAPTLAEAAEALGSHKAVLVPGHGAICVGITSVDEAVWWAITMERSCQAQLAAASHGGAVPIGPEVAEATARSVGPPMAGWRAFQPLYDWITAIQPDLFTPEAEPTMTEEHA